MKREIKQQLKRYGLRALSLTLPSVAGRLATDMFSQSRHVANPQKQAYAPFGARVIKTVRHEDSTNGKPTTAAYEMHGDGAVATHVSSPVPSTHATPAHVDEYYLWGDSGDIVLLVHGWASDCSSMFGFIKPLLAAGYRVATFDAPAHGGSPGRIATMRQYVDSIRAALLELGQVSAIIAHSLGGIAAVAAARALTGEGPEAHPRIAHQCTPLNRLVLLSAPRSLLDVLDIWSSGSLQLNDAMKQRILNELLLRNGVPVSHWDIALHGDHWDIPALIIHDSDDRVVPDHHAAQIQKVFSHAQMIQTHGLGHGRILIDREVIADCVEFLRHTARPAHRHHGLRLAAVSTLQR